jgi:hypothetical protein
MNQMASTNFCWNNKDQQKQQYKDYSSEAPKIP